MNLAFLLPDFLRHEIDLQRRIKQEIIDEYGSEEKWREVQQARMAAASWRAEAQAEKSALYTGQGITVYFGAAAAGLVAVFAWALLNGALTGWDRIGAAGGAVILTVGLVLLARAQQHRSEDLACNVLRRVQQAVGLGSPWATPFTYSPRNLCQLELGELETSCAVMGSSINSTLKRMSDASQRVAPF